MTTNGINEAFKAGYTVALRDRNGNSSGITFELKSVFDEMAQKGLLKDKDGKGLTKQEALKLYNTLHQIHQENKMDTNYSTMQAGQEFNYSAEDFVALAQAAGYEISPEALAKREIEQLPQKELPKLETPKVDNPSAEASKSVLTQKIEPVKVQEMPDKDAKVIEREVNGVKSKIAIDEVNGQKVRRQVNEDGTLGEVLVQISSAGKNKYITQSEMDNRVKAILPQGLPDGVTASFVNIAGTPQIVFKQDGQTLDQSQLREIAESQANLAQSTPQKTISSTVETVSAEPVEGTVTVENAQSEVAAMTDAQLTEFLKADVTYQKYMAMLEDLSSQIAQAEQDGGFSHKNSMDGVTTADVIKEAEFARSNPSYREIVSKYDFLQDQLKSYQQVMQNWVNGKVVSYQRVGDQLFSNITQATLTDGRRVFETDQGTFIPGPSGGLQDAVKIA